jgi:hypothetical protein
MVIIEVRITVSPSVSNMYVFRHLTDSGNKKSWEDVITYFAFTVIWISDTTRRKKTLVCVCLMKSTKQCNLGGCSFGTTDESDLWSTHFEMASGGLISIPSLTTDGSGIRVILRSCLRNLGGCNVGITDESVSSYLTEDVAARCAHLHLFIRLESLQ